MHLGHVGVGSGYESTIGLLLLHRLRIKLLLWIDHGNRLSIRHWVTSIARISRVAAVGRWLRLLDLIGLHNQVLLRVISRHIQCKFIR